MNELLIRLGCFFGAFALFSTVEALCPRRERVVARLIRWSSNIGISALNQLVVRLFAPISAMLLAEICASQGWGLLNLVPLWRGVAIFLAIMLLDLSIYVQHLLFHQVPLFWRLHRVHHADTEFDVTTGVRFHPISILFSAMLKLLIVLLIGPPAVAVLIFEVLLNITSLFNHSNVYIRPAVDKVIRLLVVTPDMHRVHHSIDRCETDSNFGFNFPWWDRLFGTYKAQPAQGHEEMVIGLDVFRAEKEKRMDFMLTQPFRNDSEE